MLHKVIQGDCEVELDLLMETDYFKGIHLTFLDPPFNQGKDYNHHLDNMPEDEYWHWMERVIKKIYNLTVDGGAIYFMQREKNTDYVLQTLRNTGWEYQNLIIWNKLSSGVPSNFRFGKKYQIIAFFTKGKKPITFNNLRYEPPLLAMHEYERETGMYLTDIWDDIRELTSGYFAGGEAIRTKNNKFFTEDGDRFHKQQSPIELLTRIILTSTNAGDFVLDPFAGTGVTAVVAKQLKRNSISIEIDPKNIEVIKKRLEMMREDDNITKFYSNYIYTKNLDEIWIGDSDSNKEQVANYYYKKIPKNNLNNTFLMKETIKLILVNKFKVPENLIEFDYRMRDNDNQIHRFDLIVRIKPKKNIIFRLIYAKNLEQANFWIKRIIYENNVVKQREPNSNYFSVISGIAFSNIIDSIKNKVLQNILIPFPSWEKTLNLPNIIEIIKSKNLFKDIKVEKQVSLDNF
ncbi:MAG: DNA methyltransferase [Promethearchaeota archaeon]